MLRTTALALTAAFALGGCGLWCEMRGGDYEIMLPPDDDETRTCVMPEEPAADAGESCTDSAECEKGCVCPAQVERRLSKLHADGVAIQDINEEHAEESGGTCAEKTDHEGFQCYIVDGKAQVDMILI